MLPMDVTTLVYKAISAQPKLLIILICSYSMCSERAWPLPGGQDRPAGPEGASRNGPDGSCGAAWPHRTLTEGLRHPLADGAGHDSTAPRPPSPLPSSPD